MKKVVNLSPKISVITVVFNDEERILETLLSVSSQTHHELEYIIIDGKSTDKTLDIIEESKVKVDILVSETDKGIYDAMNKGVRKASGDWVMFLNAGDTFFSDSTLTDIFDHKDITHYDVLYGKHMWNYGSFKKESKERPIEIMYKTLPFCHQASLSRRNLLMRYPFDLQYKIIADYDFFRKAYYSEAKFLYRPIVFANYLSTGGVSNDNLIKVYKENFKITHDLNIFYRVFLFSKKYLIHLLTEFLKFLLPKAMIDKIKKRL